LQYWYRQSSQYMIPVDFHDLLLTPATLTPIDPATVNSGMISIKLDSQGRLIYLQAIPPQLEETPAPAKAVDWNALFSAAGLDPSQFQPATPQWASLAAADTRAAWTGVWPGTNRGLRVEAAAWRGKPVYFLMVGPWTRPSRLHPEEPSATDKAGQVVFLGLFFLVLIGATWLARRNYVRGRGDRQGAFRLACVVFLLQMVLWLCRGHFVPAIEMLLPFILAISTALFLSGLVMVLYLALEPYIRRHWPQTIISWNRLLMGQFRDSLVGRDLLSGVIFGLVLVLIYEVRQFAMMRVGVPPNLYTEDFLMGGRFALGAWLLHVPVAIQATLVFFFILFIFRAMVRKDWLAAVLFIALWTTLKTMGNDHPMIEAPAQFLIYLLLVAVVFRLGLVGLATASVVADVLLNVPLTVDFSTWYATTGVLVVFSIAAIAGWGFYASLGGRPLWKEDVLT